MDYYERKKRAFYLIDKMINEGKSDAEIVYKLGTIYGFGKKVLKNRLEMIEDVSKEK